MNKKPFLKRISAVLIAALLICALPAEPSYGLLSPLSQVGAPAKVTTFKSTADTDAEEYLRAYVTTADDHVLKVIYRTPLETSLFRLSLYRVGENKGDVGLDIFIAPTMARAGNGTETYNFTYYLNMDEHEIEDGYYNIYIRRCATAEDAASLKYTNSGVLNKNMEIYVKDGQVRILRYMDVINYNRQVMEIGSLYDTSLYLDNSLEDIRFVLRNPATGVYSSITAAKLPYIQVAAKRLAALGYYTPPAGTCAGEETSYTAAMAEAAKKFQVMNDLKNTGNIANLTWKALFSEDAPVTVSDGEYEKILAEYQLRKAAQAEAENIMNGVSIKASSEAGKGYISVSWNCNAADYVDGYEVWKSTARTGGYQKMFTTSKQTYKNTAGLKKGTRYYYKVRAYKEVGGKIIYSGWSNPAYRIAK